MGKVRLYTVEFENYTYSIRASSFEMAYLVAAERFAYDFMDQEDLFAARVTVDGKEVCYTMPCELSADVLGMEET